MLQATNDSPMELATLEAYSFPVPFKQVFRHASASRDRAENVIVAARSRHGAVGYGEGCPRRYVTGETVETAARFIVRHREELARKVEDVHALRAWIAGHRDDIDRNPAAFCAVELAILDLAGKLSGRTVEEVLGLPRLDGSFRYSAVLGDAPLPAYWWQFRRYRREGFRDFKVKLSGRRGRDRRKLAVFRSRPDLRVRLDANNLGTDPGEFIRHIQALDADIFAIEEPLQAGDLGGFREVARACHTKIILDESLLRGEQLDVLDDSGSWIVNLRVSKLGGLIRSLDLAGRAARKGIGIIVGAQVGETSLLTRGAVAHERLWICAGGFGGRVRNTPGEAGPDRALPDVRPRGGSFHRGTAVGSRARPAGFPFRTVPPGVAGCVKTPSQRGTDPRIVIPAKAGIQAGWSGETARGDPSRTPGLPLSRE